MITMNGYCMEKWHQYSLKILVLCYKVRNVIRVFIFWVSYPCPYKVRINNIKTLKK